jgi:hypothetical protein
MMDYLIDRMSILELLLTGNVKRMNPKLFFLTVLGLLCHMACNSNNDSSRDSVIFLENESVKVAFLPGVGGRLVFLGRPGGDNLLKSDTSLWREPVEERIVPSPESEWKSYFGHTIWPGPQSEWWEHQDMNANRRDEKSRWPPDPYLIYAPYRLVQQTDTSVWMEGPPSPVSGVQLKKKYALSGSGLEIEVIMTNISDAPVSWDIWSNARFEGSTLSFVPACEEGVTRVRSTETENVGGLDSVMFEGAFSLASPSLESGKSQWSSKAFLHPGQGAIVAVRNKSMLEMSFDYVERKICWNWSTTRLTKHCNRVNRLSSMKAGTFMITQVAQVWSRLLNGIMEENY